MDTGAIRQTIERIAARSPLPKELQYGRFAPSSSYGQLRRNSRAGWGYAPVATGRELREAEYSLEIELPTAPQIFYKPIGNGGPSPGDGSLPLAELVARSPRADKRFPHTKCWSDQSLANQAFAANPKADREGGSIEAAIQAGRKHMVAGFPDGGLVVARAMGGDLIVVVNGPETGNM